MELICPTRHEIACHFFASHISGALIPATRLSKILEKMFHGQKLTALSLKYLKEMNLDDLHQLASGQITYETFAATLEPAAVALERAARGKQRAVELELLAQEANRTARIASEQATTAKYQAVKLERLAQKEAEWAAQSKRNRDSAETRYKAAISEPGYIAPTPRDIAQHYRINNHPEVLISPLSNILKELYQGRPLSADYLTYLKMKGFSLLHELATGQTTYESYISDTKVADAAQAARIKQAEVQKRQREKAAEAARIARIEQAEAQRRQREAAESARIARETDPAYTLRKKYEIVDKIGQSLLPRLMNILENIDAGNRMAGDDYAWLTTTANRHYFTAELRKIYHLREAEFFASEYRRTQGPWNAINASGHYRKCEQPESALKLLTTVPPKSFKQPKIHSAMCTTRGGAMRDMGMRNEALQLGKQAHALQPINFRPCTLLGALNIELRNFAEGQDWYSKAEERGASKQIIDADLKGIFHRANKELRKTMRAYLLENDPERYHWVNDKKYRHI